MIPPGVPECVAGENPPRSSGSDNMRSRKVPGTADEPRDLWTTARAKLTHAGLQGVPPDLYLAREVMTCLSCFPVYRDTLVVNLSRGRLPWVGIGCKEPIAIDRITMLK